MWEFDDARTPTDAERQRLARLMYLAFCDHRALALEGRAEQAKDLAAAFHNIPLQAFHDFLERYQQRYPGKLLFDYLQEWQKLNSDSASA